MDENETHENEQETEQPPEEGGKRRRRGSVAVQCLEREGEAVLVQWLDGEEVRRCYVPAAEIVGGKVAKSALKEGAPYGILWEEVLDTSQFTPENLARHLRKAGIWTRRDVERKPKAVERAVLRASGISAGTLHAAASKKTEE